VHSFFKVSLPFSLPTKKVQYMSGRKISKYFGFTKHTLAKAEKINADKAKIENRKKLEQTNIHLKQKNNNYCT
jgi:hypothetical protein